MQIMYYHGRYNTNTIFPQKEEIFTVYFKPENLTLGIAVETQIQNNNAI